MNRGASPAPSIERRLTTEPFSNANGAVDGNPSHDLRMGEVLARAAYLPDAFVRLCPDLLDLLNERAGDPPSLPMRGQSGSKRLEHGVHDLDRKSTRLN